MGLHQALRRVTLEVATILDAAAVIRPSLHQQLALLQRGAATVGTFGRVRQLVGQRVLDHLAVEVSALSSPVAEARPEAMHLEAMAIEPRSCSINAMSLSGLPSTAPGKT